MQIARQRRKYLSMFIGMSSTVFASVGAYTVTFSLSNATVTVNGSTVTSASSSSDGDLSFSTVPDSGYEVTSLITNTTEGKFSAC